MQLHYVRHYLVTNVSVGFFSPNTKDILEQQGSKYLSIVKVSVKSIFVKEQDVLEIWFNIFS